MRKSVSPETMSEDLDRRFMAAAMRLGAGALGSTWPNPAVGAIVVKDGSAVGRGRTHSGGRPHGEALALGMAGDAARGATMYVSLEPCSHHGKTPPCADAIIAAGVAKVVCTMPDPDPRVAGRGLARLRAAGIDVATGVLAGEAKRMQAGHLRRVASDRPHVLLKLAVSADDAIGRRGEAQAQVTGAIARRHAQALRSRFDAILVGRGTIETDDPSLTCRLPGLSHRSPVRVAIDTHGRLASTRKVFSDHTPTWVFVGDGKANEKVHSAEDRVRTFAASRRAEGLDLAACLRRLAQEGITRLLAEGGAQVARNLLEADLVDEVMLFRSPEKLGGDIVPALAGIPLGEIESSARFRRIERRRFGADRMTHYERAA